MAFDEEIEETKTAFDQLDDHVLALRMIANDFWPEVETFEANVAHVWTLAENVS